MAAYSWRASFFTATTSKSWRAGPPLTGGLGGPTGRLPQASSSGERGNWLSICRRRTRCNSSLDAAGRTRRRANAVQDWSAGQTKTNKRLFPDDAGTDGVFTDSLLGIQHRDIEARQGELISRIQPSRTRPDHSNVSHQRRVTSRHEVLTQGSSHLRVRLAGSSLAESASATFQIEPSRE